MLLGPWTLLVADVGEGVGKLQASSVIEVDQSGSSGRVRVRLGAIVG